MVSPRPAGATNIQTERAKANALYLQVKKLNNQVDTLGQKYNLTQIKLQQLNNLIAHSRQVVAEAQQQVATNRAGLRQAAVNAYINAGAQMMSNPLFSTDAASNGARTVYNTIAEGDLSTSVSSLRLSTIRLTSQRQILQSQQSSAQHARDEASNTYKQALAAQQQAQRLLNSARGKIAYFLRQAQRQAEAAAQAQWAKNHPNNHHGWPPQPNTRAGRAVAFAYSMIGVPYVWAGTSRRGVDCSGLTMLSWQAAGVGLPHYSGSQMSSTIRVPLYSLQPGDLLFYGRGGSSHVTIYIGNRRMIEAASAGTRVHISPVRYSGLAGAGRPRG
jgi:cell wall-associated NlpC family hydrolase